MRAVIIHVLRPPPWAAAQCGYSSVWPGNISSHGKRVCWQGQTGPDEWGSKWTAKGTLLLSNTGLTNVTEEPRMGRAALRIVRARFVEAQRAVDGQAHIGGVCVFLAVVLPPADRAKLHCFRSFRGFQGPVSAARAAKAGCNSLHD